MNQHHWAMPDIKFDHSYYLKKKSVIVFLTSHWYLFVAAKLIYLEYCTFIADWQNDVA